MASLWTSGASTVALAKLAVACLSDIVGPPEVLVVLFPDGDTLSLYTSSGFLPGTGCPGVSGLAEIQSNVLCLTSSTRMKMAVLGWTSPCATLLQGVPQKSTPLQEGMVKQQGGASGRSMRAILVIDYTPLCSRAADASEERRANG